MSGQRKRRKKNVNITVKEVRKSIPDAKKASMKNWSGSAITMNSIDFHDMRNVREMKKSGVYVLFYKDNEVYIGSTYEDGDKNLYRAILNKDKDVRWENALVVGRSKGKFTEKEVNYLRDRLMRSVLLTKDYKVKKGMVLDGRHQKVKGNIRWYLRENYEKTLLLVNELGFKFDNSTNMKELLNDGKRDYMDVIMDLTKKKNEDNDSREANTKKIINNLNKEMLKILKKMKLKKDLEEDMYKKLKVFTQYIGEFKEYESSQDVYEDDIVEFVEYLKKKEVKEKDIRQIVEALRIVHPSIKDERKEKFPTSAELGL